ncbi:hypothetical protein [Streptosporangium jomthongense]
MGRAGEAGHEEFGLTVTVDGRQEVRLGDPGEMPYSPAEVTIRG